MLSFEPEHECTITIQKSRKSPEHCTRIITFGTERVAFVGNMPIQDALYSAIDQIKNDGGRLQNLHGLLLSRKIVRIMDALEPEEQNHDT